MLTTTTPADWARASTGARAFESAGAMTIASLPEATICSTRATCWARSLSFRVPLTIRSYSSG